MTWGCPYHGLVRYSKITLPNGAQQNYPQPPATQEYINGFWVGLQDGAGVAHRVAVPGLPAPELTDAEQTQATAAGWQWRNEAILAGGRMALHGTPLGGWIYIDPDGARWLVRIPAASETQQHSFAQPFSATVTLERFGDPVAAESYQYQVASEWGGIPARYTNGAGRLLVDAIKPDGSAAILMVHTRTISEFSGAINREPYSFLELTIAGPGAAATVALGVARSFSQTNRIGPPPFTWQANSSGLGSWLQASGSRESTKTLAVRYDAAGAHQDFELRHSGTYAYDIPETSGANEGGSSEASETMALLLNGTVLDSISLSFSISCQPYFIGAFDSRMSYAFSISIDGVSVNGTGDTSNQGSVPYPDAAKIGAQDPTLHQDFAANGVASEPHLYIPSAGIFFGWVRVHPFSRQVMGLEIATSGLQAGDRTWKYRPPVTPAGLAPGQPITIPSALRPALSGAYDPYNGACVWGETTSVCYV